MPNLLTVQHLLALPAIKPTESYAYGKHSEQFGYLYLPKSMTGRKLPVAILIHGGCWQADVSLEYFGQAANVLTKLGLAVWNLEYRRLGNGGGWPATFQDVAAGADFLRSVADTHQLDLENAVSVGHSAGGQLALWLAARKHLRAGSELYSPNPLWLKGVISIAGIPDLVSAYQHSICDEAAHDLLGRSTAEFEARAKQASPSELLPLGVRQVLINGDLDDIVPPTYVKAYVSKAKSMGERVDYLKLKNIGHYEPVIPGTKAWTQVEKAILGLLNQK